MEIIILLIAFIVCYILLYLYVVKKQKNSNSKSSIEKPTYIISESSNTFHRPDCPYVKKIDSLNLNTKHSSYSTLISIGCKPCKKCKPQPLERKVIQKKELPAPEPTLTEPIQQKEIKNFTFDEAVDVYVNTAHHSCPSKYQYKQYFSDAFCKITEELPRVNITISDEKVNRQSEINNPIDSYKNITKSTNFSKIRDFVAIDTETTGLKVGGNDIIEIAAIKFIDYRPAEIFHTYLKPRKEIPAAATEVNGITDDMVADSPTFSQIKPNLQEFIGNLPLVAHNAPFDIKFLYVSGLDLEKHKGKTYDTLALSRLKVRDYTGDKLDSYKLSDVCEELNIACEKYHNAAADALACGLIFVDIIKIVNETEDIRTVL